MGTNNTASGFQALFSNTGSYNTANGYWALNSNTAGAQNTASGDYALQFNTTGNNNTASGLAALNSNTTGSANTAEGLNALRYRNGSNNTGIGAYAGVPTPFATTLTGSLNTYVGYFANSGTQDVSNATAIGALAQVTASNAMVLGSINNVNGATADTLVGIGDPAPVAKLTVSGVETSGNGYAAAIKLANTSSGGGNWYLRAGATGTFTPAGGFTIANDSCYCLTIDLHGNVGIATLTPDALLSVNGNADKSGGGSWGTFSDRRLKNLDGTFASGLDQVLKLRPVRYRYKADNALGIRDHEEHIGLVAQEVKQVLPEAVTENNKGYLLVNNDPIIWAMLNAIKEQQQQIRALRKRAVRLESKLTELQRERGQVKVASVK